MHEIAPTNSTARVLVVDDDDVVAKTIAAILDELRIGVVGFAANGQEAVSLARTMELDVILMDVDMPILDGLQATDRLRRDGIATPVLILSGDPTRRARAHAAGADAFLAKSSLTGILGETVIALATEGRLPAGHPAGLDDPADLTTGAPGHARTSFRQ